MWSARWGHVAVVFNDTAPRSDFTLDENSERLEVMQAKLLVLGGDDRVSTTMEVSEVFEVVCYICM